MIDVTFDYRRDSSGRDPDSYSRQLRLDHALLWSRRLPSGGQLALKPVPGHYLVTETDAGLFSLSSDTISNSFRSNRRLQGLVGSLDPSLLDSFQAIGSTIGGRVLFPGKRRAGRLTINVARGFNPAIKDRFDLTLECIRLQYLGLENPLSETLSAYWNFFDLFEDFEGYVEFFLLQDLLDDGEVRFFMADSVLGENPLPDSMEQYLEYRSKSMAFTVARNERIASLPIQG